MTSMPLLSSGGWLSPCLQGTTFCSMPGARTEGASAVPGCGWGLECGPGLCVRPGAWENLWGVAPCPQSLSGQLRESILLKCLGWKDQRQGDRVFQWKRVCRKTSELAQHREGEPAAAPGAGCRAPGGPQPRRRPGPRPETGVANPVSPMTTAPEATGGQDPGGWTGFPGTPRPQRLLGSGCWQRGKGPR